jgi:hypothetical protein
MNAFNYWKEEEEIKLLGEIVWGIDIYTIAQRHGRSYNAIVKRLEKIAHDMYLKNVPGDVIKIKTRIEINEEPNLITNKNYF